MRTDQVLNLKNGLGREILIMPVGNKPSAPVEGESL